ncbi:22599_t:CDS:2, partial [Dentiscutata erythropus]
LNISHGRIQKHENIPVNSQRNSDSQFKKRQAIEPSVAITNILEQYWDIPKEITLLSALLDPQYKKLKIVTETQYDTLYNNLPKLSLTNEPSNINQVNYSLLRLSDEEESNMSNKVICYLALPKEAQECNILEWWKEQVNILPVLSRLAMKYLSIPATSVPNKRLFSDASLHLSACHSCLKPELLASILFLKRNMKLFVRLEDK